MKPYDVPDTLILDALVKIHDKELKPFIEAERKDRAARTDAANKAGATSKLADLERIRILEARIKELEEAS